MGGCGCLPHTKRAKIVQKLEKGRTERTSQKDLKDILGRYVQGANIIGHFFAGYWCGTPIFMIIVQMQIFEHLE